MKTLLKTTAFLCMAFFLLNSCDEKKKDDKKKDAETTTTKAKAQANYDLADADTSDSDCECETNWFPHTQTPAPAEGANSPFAASETTNCIFHQWSWQKFLWLTVPDSNNTPLFLRDTSISQIDPYMNPVTVPSGTSLALSASEEKQAGSAGILESNPSFNNGSSATVYYAIFMNDTMYETATTYGDQLLNGTLDANNSKVYPVGSFELKTSWVATTAIPQSDLANYYITNASIDGTTTEVALLGMHVVGVVENHPEFIWATFEHNNLAPVFNWTKGTASADVEKLLFKQGSVSNLDGITWSGSSPKVQSEAYTLFQYGVPRVEGSDPTTNFMETSQSEPENYNNISTIDQCVAKNLTDVWNNYAYTGSIWINTDGLTPDEQVALLKSEGYNLGNATPGSVARGSLNSANISMETYTQTFESSLSSIDASNLTNCLSCHSAKSFSSGNPTSPLYLSHAFNGYLEHQKGKSKEEIHALKVREFQEAFLKPKK
ncbi:hypothetical protein [uncultured Kordia sp.]|uniref:hypothetical protein n=1 Tax=uncultured Kordia sp. TaxID=507699 RepID=UPI0026276736|nr:hypothetical protein [uncultured Kordia sp.]